MIRVCVVFAALVVSGCSWSPLSWWSSDEKTPPPAKPAATCPADRFQDRVGGLLIGSSQPQPGTGAFLRVSDLPHPHRILTEGMAVSGDRNPARLSVHLDPLGRVARLTCD